MDSNQSKLTGEHKAFVIERIAAWAEPSEVVEDVKREFGITITPQAVAHYRRADRWQERIQELRQRNDERGRKSTPIDSRAWRQEQRRKVISRIKGNASQQATVLRALKDAALEAGDLRQGDDGQAAVAGVSIGTVNIIGQMLQLPVKVLERYVETGELAPSDYLADVRQAQDGVMQPGSDKVDYVPSVGIEASSTAAPGDSSASSTSTAPPQDGPLPPATAPARPPATATAHPGDPRAQPPLACPTGSVRTARKFW